MSAPKDLRQPAFADVRDLSLVVPSHVFVREFDGELVLLDLEGGDYFGLSELGLVLWNGLVAGKTPRQVATEAVAQYDVDLPTMTEDFAKLTEELLAKGLLLRGANGA